MSLGISPEVTANSFHQLREVQRMGDALAARLEPAVTEAGQVAWPSARLDSSGADE